MFVGPNHPMFRDRFPAGSPSVVQPVCLLAQYRPVRGSIRSTQPVVSLEEVGEGDSTRSTQTLVERDRKVDSVVGSRIGTNWRLRGGESVR